MPEKFIVLSPTSKDEIKDWIFKDIKDFIDKANLPVVLIGTEKAKNLANKLIEFNTDFIDLTNKTTISELGAIIKLSEFCVSVDTGTLHLSYSQGVKTIGLFFNKAMAREWAPENRQNLKLLFGEKKIIENNLICTENITAKDVIATIEKF